MPQERVKNEGQRKSATLANGRALVAMVSLGLAAAPGMGQGGGNCQYEPDVMHGPSCGADLANTYAAGISDEGHICGWYACAGGNDKAFVAWNAGTVTPIVIPGSSQSRATDINGTTIVGHFGQPGGFRGFRLQDHVLTTIQPLAGGNWVEVARANMSGVIVGSWGNIVIGPYPQAFRWENGVMQNLQPALLAPDSEALDINDNGVITGWMGQNGSPFVTTGFAPHAFIWNNGVVTDIGLMPFSLGTEARGINNSNQVCGIAWFPAPNPQGWVRRGFLWQNGYFTDLGTIPGYTEVHPQDIAEDGTIVGRVSVAPGQTDGGSFVWHDGALHLLETLINPPESLALISARAINSRGEIADWANDADDKGVRLQPLREPADTNCDAVVNINDLLAVINNWGQPGGVADVDFSGLVDISDLLMVINNWG